MKVQTLTQLAFESDESEHHFLANNIIKSKKHEKFATIYYLLWTDLESNLKI